MKFSQLQMRARAIRRLAECLYDHSEEGRNGHSRMFEVLVPDEFVIDGRSMEGGTYREHVVPCMVIRDGCMAMYQRGSSVAEVEQMIDKYLRIVLISHEEAGRLDRTLGLKTRMPHGWVFGEGDPMARLDFAGIKLAVTAPASPTQTGALAPATPFGS